MKNYSIVTVNSWWSTKKLIIRAEQLIKEKVNEGFEIKSVSIGFDVWYIPTAYITICK
jgi:hypothetical protein